MSFESQTYHSPIYRNFRNIDAGEFRHIIRYYERYEKEILQLDFEEYIELLVTYTHALFEIGDYSKHLLMADVVVRTSILQNVTKVRGKEIYHATLFKKAASHYNLHEYSEAKHILEELIKMNPYNTLTVQFLGRVMRDNKPRYLRNTHAASVLFFLLSAFTICIEVLVVKNFYTAYAPAVEIFRNVLFFLGIALLSSSEFWHRWQVYHYVQNFKENVKKYKKMKALKELGSPKGLNTVSTLKNSDKNLTQLF